MHIQSFDQLCSSPELDRAFSLMWSEGCPVYLGGDVAGYVQLLKKQLAINELIVLHFDRRLLEIARKVEPYD